MARRRQNLVIDKNPYGTITNSDLELAGGLLHQDIIAQHYDVRERTIVSKTDNLATMFWQCKGSTTTEKVPAHLLHEYSIYQRYHRYVLRYNYIPGPSNPMADDASRLFHLSHQLFLSYFNFKYSQILPYLHVQITSKMCSSVISALHKKTCSVESLLVEPTAPVPTGKSSAPSPIN